MLLASVCFLCNRYGLPFRCSEQFSKIIGNVFTELQWFVLHSLARSRNWDAFELCFHESHWVHMITICMQKRNECACRYHNRTPPRAPLFCKARTTSDDKSYAVQLTKDAVLNHTARATESLSAPDTIVSIRSWCQTGGKNWRSINLVARAGMKSWPDSIWTMLMVRQA